MNRGSGILLHITSLPSVYGTGDFGRSGYDFARFLKQSGQKYWQVLPLGPLSEQRYHSPYSSNSVYALNPMFIDPRDLVSKGLLDKKFLKRKNKHKGGSADYIGAERDKTEMINHASAAFNFSNDSRFDHFCTENSWWLDDYALFSTIKSKISCLKWTEWPKEIRDREKKALNSIRKTYSSNIRKQKFIQYMLFSQWASLKNYCNSLGISIIGDLPIYPCLNSAEVWSNPHIFKLGPDKKPIFVGGVPPDYYSSTGQLWGNPVYDWKQLKAGGYSWWIKRLEHNFRLFDITRIDHFRGLVAYWEIASGQKDAVHGRWVDVPVQDFMDTLIGKFENLPVIAEDLGVITDDVKYILKKYRLPTMKVLLFAFSRQNHPYMPHNYERNCYVYTGTHDNDTVRGWFEEKADKDEIKRAADYLGADISANDINWSFIRLAMASVADVCIFPMQDVLGLGNKARMNLPSTVKKNWKWRLKARYASSQIKERLFEMAKTYGRI